NAAAAAEDPLVLQRLLGDSVANPVLGPHRDLLAVLSVLHADLDHGAVGRRVLVALAEGDGGAGHGAGGFQGGVDLLGVGIGHEDVFVVLVLVREEAFELALADGDIGADVHPPCASGLVHLEGDAATQLPTVLGSLRHHHAGFNRGRIVTTAGG